MSPIDVARARAETPGCAEVVHLNNAGASLPTRGVLEAVIGHLEREARIGGYEAEAEAAEAIANVTVSGARLLGAAPHEVAFVGSASEGWWRAFSAVPLEVGDRVLIGRAEYVANAFGVLQARRRGVSVELIPDDSSGQVDLDALAGALDERVRLVAMTHVPTSGGLVNPVEEIGALAKANGSLYLVDACQSAGQLPVDVERIGCDFLALTGRKFLRGPRGTGLLYVRSSVLDELDDPVFIDGHSAEWTGEWEYRLEAGARRFELFESPVASRIGFGVAIEEALAWGIAAIEDRVVALAAGLRDQLGEIPGVTVQDQGARRCAIVSFTADHVPASTLVPALRDVGINTSVVSAASARLSMDRRHLAEMVRASVHYFTTEDELAQLVAFVGAAARG